MAGARDIDDADPDLDGWRGSRAVGVLYGARADGQRGVIAQRTIEAERPAYG